jgi:hypothetical protein
MRRLAADLEAVENEDDDQVEGHRALLEWLNDRRAERGLAPVETVEEEVPELGFYRRAKALGMVRPRRSDS